MTIESAIVEEDDMQTDDLQELDQDDPAIDQYDIQEPDDGDNEEFKVPVIDDLEDDDQKVPSSQDKKETAPKDKAQEDTGKEKVTDTKTKNLPDELIAKARKLGISDEDISVFEKPEQLERLCNLIKPTATETQDNKEKQTQEKSETSYEEGDFKLELDPDLYDPDLCKAMQSTAGQINGIKKLLNDVVVAIRSQSEESFEKNFEGMIAGLGDEFADTLGQGSLSDIGTDSDFYKNRCKLVEEMNAIAAGYAQTGKPLPAYNQLFKRALNSVFGDKIKTNARKEVASQLEKRSNQIISRPTGRKGKDSQTPDQRATSAVRQKLQEFGAYEETEIEEDF